MGGVYGCGDYGHHRWTVDYPEDFQLVTAIYEALWRPDRHFTMDDVLAYLEAHPEVYRFNRRYVGKEGYEVLWGTE